MRQSSNHVRLRRRLFIFYRYHEFKIKGPVGTSFYVFPAHGNRDPFALNCVLPEVSEIPESLLDVPLISKSSRKSYTLREVAGRQIGHVQYFLNRELKLLLDCGKIFRIEGYVIYFPGIQYNRERQLMIPTDYFPEIPVMSGAPNEDIVQNHLT